MGIGHSARRAALLACSWLLAGGCSGESANSGNSESTCKQVCEAIDGATCPGENMADCLEVCATTDQTCPAARDAFAACVQETPPTTCDSNGNAEFIGCEKEWLAVVPCNICVPRQVDTAAQKCLKEKCCPELQDAYSRVDIFDYLDCLSTCGGTDICANQCATKYPETAVRFSAVQACEQGDCP